MTEAARGARVIYVSSLAAMPGHARRLGADDLVSIIQPEFQPPTPDGITAARHHRVAVHDIVDPDPGQILADADDIAGLVGFLDRWTMEAPLLVHCYAGISRSTATALIAYVMKTGDAHGGARALRAAAPHAAPNRHIIDIADRLLSLGGELSAAVAAIGRPRVSLMEAPLTRLDLPAG